MHEALGQSLIEGIVVIQKYRHALEAFGGGVTFFKEKMEVFIDNIYCFISFHIRMNESYGLLNKEHLGSDLLGIP